MSKSLSLLKKFVIILCVIALLATCVTISTKYILQKRMQEIVETIKGDNVEIDLSIANEINETLRYSKNIDTYEECFLSAIISKYNGEYEEAVSYFEKAVEYAETDIEKADLYRKIGIIYSQQSEYQKALEYLAKALNKNPEDQNALLYKAECYLQQLNYADAIKSINQYTKIYDLSIEQYETVITMYVTMGDYDGAIETANKAIEKYPNQESNFILYRLQANALKDDFDNAKLDAELYLNMTDNETDPDIVLASYLYALGKYEKALEMYVDFIDNRDMSNLYSQAIECAYQIDDYDAMLKLSEDALKYYEGDEEIEYYKWKAIALMQKNNFKEAIKCFNKYIDVNTEHYEVIYLRALCYFTLGTYEKAIEDFSTTIAGEMLVEDSLYNRALCYIQINDLDNAILDLREVVNTNSGTETYQSALELLTLLDENGDEPIDDSSSKI